MFPYLYIIFIGLAFISSLISFRLDYSIHLKIFSVLLGLTLVNELLAVYGLVLVNLKTNLPIYNIFILIEFWVFGWFFYQIISNKKVKLFIKIFLILFPIFWIVAVFYLFGFNSWNSYVIITGSAFTIFLSAFYYYELFTSQKLLMLTRLPEFWIATGLIIFYSGNLPFTGMLNYLSINYRDLAIQLLTVLRILIIIMYSIFTYAFLCPIITRKSS